MKFPQSRRAGPCYTDGGRALQGRINPLRSENRHDVAGKENRGDLRTCRRAKNLQLQIPCSSAGQGIPGMMTAHTPLRSDTQPEVRSLLRFKRIRRGNRSAGIPCLSPMRAAHISPCTVPGFVSYLCRVRFSDQVVRLAFEYASGLRRSFGKFYRPD